MQFQNPAKVVSLRSNSRKDHFKVLGSAFFTVCAYTAFLPEAWAVAPLKESFDAVQVGAPPPGWQSGSQGTNGHPHWTVTTGPNAVSKPNVLQQDGKAVSSWLVQPAFQAESGTVSCKFRIDSGKEDPEAGLIVRFRDGKNYAYVRANTLESDVIFYRMVDGRKEVVKRVETAVSPATWHKLRIDFAGNGFKVTYDDKGIMNFTDNKINGVGSVGFWTTADTVAQFDDFEAAGS